MYMGVILGLSGGGDRFKGAPHVYGGDPLKDELDKWGFECSPCIWG